MKTVSLACLTLLMGGATFTIANATPPEPIPQTMPDRPSHDQGSADASNQEAAAQANARQTAVDDANASQQAANQAQYDQDMAAYREALRANHREAMADARHYDHQQRAYADAMRDWRRQVYACKHGSMAACNAPSPNPADYW